jgi:hypothetical protein
MGALPNAAAKQAERSASGLDAPQGTAHRALAASGWLELARQGELHGMTSAAAAGERRATPGGLHRRGARRASLYSVAPRPAVGLAACAARKGLLRAHSVQSCLLVVQVCAAHDPTLAVRRSGAHRTESSKRGFPVTGYVQHPRSCSAPAVAQPPRLTVPLFGLAQFKESYSPVRDYERPQFNSLSGAHRSRIGTCSDEPFEGLLCRRVSSAVPSL